MTGSGSGVPWSRGPPLPAWSGFLARPEMALADVPLAAGAQGRALASLAIVTPLLLSLPGPFMSRRMCTELDGGWGASGVTRTRGFGQPGTVPGACAPPGHPVAQRMLSRAPASSQGQRVSRAPSVVICPGFNLRLHRLGHLSLAETCWLPAGTVTAASGGNGKGFAPLPGLEVAALPLSLGSGHCWPLSPDPFQSSRGCRRRLTKCTPSSASPAPRGPSLCPRSTTFISGSCAEG